MIVGDSIIRPLYAIGLNLDSLPDDHKTTEYIQKVIASKRNDFNQVYDTYPDGVAKLIVDRYRIRRGEYEIGLTPSGTIRSIKYFWDNKRRKGIR